MGYGIPPTPRPIPPKQASLMSGSFSQNMIRDSNGIGGITVRSEGQKNVEQTIAEYTEKVNNMLILSNRHCTVLNMSYS